MYQIYGEDRVAGFDWQHDLSNDLHIHKSNIEAIGFKINNTVFLISLTNKLFFKYHSNGKKG